MDAGRGSYLCGLVLGVALGVAATHLTLSSRSAPHAPPQLSFSAPFDGIPARIELPPLPSLPDDYAPKSSTVHAIATSPVETQTAELPPLEAPRPLPDVQNAEPLSSDEPAAPAIAPAPVQRDDPELREFIRDELQNSAASEHEVWYETLHGMSRADATEILRIWKMNRSGQLPSLQALPDFAQLSPKAATVVADAAATEELPPSRPTLRQICLHNIANASTPGFKRWEVLEFERMQDGLGKGPLQSARHVSLDMTEGSLRNTRRPLDCAIDPSRYGFFQVRQGDVTLVTRCGRFVLDDQRRIALPQPEGPPCPLHPLITIPEGNEVRIAQNGTVTCSADGSTTTNNVGKLELVNFDDPTALRPVGGNLLVATAVSGAAVPVPADDVFIQSGYLEQSNVNLQVEHERLELLTWLEEEAARSPTKSDRIFPASTH